MRSGPPAAIANAVSDALSPFGIVVTGTPITPRRVYELLVEAGRDHLEEPFHSLGRHRETRHAVGDAGRVGDRACERRAHADDPALAHAFGAERIRRRRRVLEQQTSTAGTSAPSGGR